MPLLLNHNHLDEAYLDHQDGLRYDPSVPLPAYYLPPENLQPHHGMPPIEQPQLYPLIILQASDNYQTQELPSHQPQNPTKIPNTREPQPCIDTLACKIGSFIIIAVLLCCAALIVYLMFKKYMK